MVTVPTVKLTTRESQVLHLMALGLTTGEIATIISTGEDNVKIHLRKVYRAFGVRRGSGAAREALTRAYVSGLLNQVVMSELLDRIVDRRTLNRGLLDTLSALWAEEESVADESELPEPQHAGDHGDDTGTDGEGVEASADAGRDGGEAPHPSDEVDDHDPDDDDGDACDQAGNDAQDDG